MSLRDREIDRSFSGSGGFRAALARIFGESENPLEWAVTLGSVSGIRIKLTLIFLVYALAQVLWSIPRDVMGPGYTLSAMLVLFGIVLLHEFGHCFACRAVKGEADQILLWPLGGLASCAPPPTWLANLITTVGGPAVNVLIFPITALALALTGNADTILFNPIQPGMTLAMLDSWWLVALWWTHYINIILLAFNVLVPMFPLDGGRILHAVLWSRQGARRSMEITVTVGLLTAVALAIIALTANVVLLAVIAAFGGLTCWVERRRLRAEADLGGAGPGFLGGSSGDARWDDDEDEIVQRREQRRLEREHQEQLEVDRILAKIAATGMDSLTQREKAALKRATKRRQRG